jgi:hypothetical protein
MARGEWHVRAGRLVRRGTFERADIAFEGNSPAVADVAPVPRPPLDGTVAGAQPLAVEADAQLARNLP